MLIIQALLVIFFLVASVKVRSKFIRKEISAGNAIFWLLFWLLAAAVAVWPNLTASFAKIVGVGRGADLVVYVSLASIFYLLFRIMVKVEKNNKDITEIARKIALNQDNKLSHSEIHSRGQLRNQENNELVS